jgi:adenylate cyclase
MGTATAIAGRMGADDLDADGRVALAKRVHQQIKWSEVLAHGIGAIDLFALLFFVLPAPHGVDPSDHVWPNLVGMVVYLPLTMVIGELLSRRWSAAYAGWIREGRDPNAEERRVILQAPSQCLRINAAFWLGAAVLFGAINLPASADLALHVSATIVLGGITTCAVAYLLIERYQRPITAIALAAGGPRRAAWPGVEGRLVLAWVSATLSPLLGLLMLALHGLYDPTVSREEVSRSVAVLSAATIFVGLGVTLLVARSVAHPLRALRRALSRVEGGDFAAGVEVDDASEVGQLQNGFNRMVEGLRDRERVKDLYSRQVGADVAQVSLDEGMALGGNVCDVAVLFIDMVGSTEMAASMPPEHVVDRLNRFFAIVVEVVADHGGWVNKFEGDAALCVFGAPAEQPDASGCALAAGRDLQARLREDMPGTEAGIGLSAGPVVAGWIGAEQRFEYTVIGDAVNEAARLCELAKRRPERLLASEAIVDRAARAEANLWKKGEETVLRGRTTPTRLAAPLPRAL